MTSSTPTLVHPESTHSDGRWPRRLRLFLVAATVGLGLWGVLRWSLMADRIDNRITEAEWAEEGPAFKVIVLDDGRVLTIDDALMTRLSRYGPVPGRRLVTDPARRRATIGGHPVALKWSSTATRAMVLLSGILIAGQVRHHRSRAARSGRPDGAEDG